MSTVQSIGMRLSSELPERQCDRGPGGRGIGRRAMPVESDQHRHLVKAGEERERHAPAAE